VDICLRIDILKALIGNSTLLVVAFLFLSRFSRWKVFNKTAVNKIVQGSAYALCGLLAILFSVEVRPGVLIDMRTPILVVASFTGGAAVGIIAALPLLFFRLFIGGAGVYAGAGIIVTAFLFGLALRILEKSRLKTTGIVFHLIPGLGSALIYFLWILVLPGQISTQVLGDTFFPLTVTSVISILAIFFIRKREVTHQSLLNSLREVNDLFDEIALDENLGIFVVQKEKIVFINSPMLNKLGLVESAETCYEEAYLKVRDMLGINAKGIKQEAVPIEVAFPDRNSLHFLVHTRNVIYRGEDSMLVVSADVTRIVLTEKALKKRVEQLHLSLDASGGILWKASIPTDRLTADDDFFQLLHYFPTENPPLFSHWIINASLTDKMRQSAVDLQSGKVDSIFGELSHSGNDGVTRWFNMGARITEKGIDGKPQEVTGILYETTEIKEKEQSLMRKEIEDLQSQKIDTIGRLAGGVAHDFNNILHVIIGYAEILNKVSGNDSVVREIAEPIVEAAEKGRELVKQLLLFSRDKKPELQCVTLSAVTDNFCRLLQRVLEENILISTDIQKNTCAILGDTGQIEQVLMNLCVNSRDAMSSGGTITISLKEIFLNKTLTVTTGMLDPGIYAMLSVADTGPGIPSGKHRLIFEPFFTTKQVDKGTGLGLATVLGIIKGHSGQIDVQNRPEGGVEIVLYFPSASLSDCGNSILPSPVELSDDSNRSRRAVCVLLAEDNEQVMNLAVEGLGAEGIRVLKARTGRDAVEVYKNNRDRIDMLVFDVVMPELSGPDAYREILALGGNKPVVFTTGYAGDMLTGIKGRYHVVSKPYSIKDLASVIRTMLKPETGENNGRQ
jgi:signal transduction histidine kinase